MRETGAPPGAPAQHPATSPALPGGSTPRLHRGSDDPDITAFHEAGHLWAYNHYGLAVRYATIRPRQGLLGRVAVWPRRVGIAQKMVIASAGPVAEAMYTVAEARHTFQYEDDDADLEWSDHLDVALVNNGIDLAASRGMLDSPETTTHIRGLLQQDWARITRVAERLLREGTISGRDSVALLGDSR